MRPQASPTRSFDDTEQELPALPLTEHDVALLHEIVKLADGQSDVSAHPRKVLFDAYHSVFKQYGVDTSKDKACLRVLLSLAGPHVPGNTLMERFKGIIQQAGFELEYTNDDLHIDQVRDAHEQGVSEAEAIPQSVQLQHVRPVRQQPQVAELEDLTREQALRPQNRRSMPEVGRGSQLSSNPPDGWAGMPYPGKSTDPYATHGTASVDVATQNGSVTDNQTEHVVFPEADQAAIEEFARRMTAMEELAISKDSHQLKADSFRIWRNSTREKKATDFHRMKLFARVASQFSSCQHDGYTADALHREIVAKRSKEALGAWRAETRLRPLEQRLSYRHDLRLAQQCMGNLRTLVRLPSHAESVREKALTRKGFDAWGEELRVFAMKEKIDHRLRNTSLYWWILATRESIQKRQLDQRRTRRAINEMLTYFRHQQDRFRASEATFGAGKKARRTIAAFVAMSSKLDQQKRHEQMADDFYHPKIEFENLTLWKDRLSGVQRLTLRANDVYEYFLSVKILKIWRTRTKESREHRLNRSYKHVRRRGKIRIVRAGLDTWRTEYNRLQMLDGVGQDFAKQREHRLLRKHFTRWQNKTSQVAGIERQVTAQVEARRLARTFSLLRARSEALKVFGQKADKFHAIHVADSASKQLRKLKTKAFELRRRQQDADAMKDRHEKSHYRSMLRLWARKASGQETDLAPLDHPEEVAERIMDESLLPDIEDDEAGMPGPNTHKKRTPVPEYLHTPSNRAAKVRRLATSTTPATAPSSFAARLLAGGISLTPRGPPPARRLNESTMG